jgi:hypothetical protein
MKLQELRMDTQSAPKEVLSTNGTYVAVVPNESTLALLADWSAKAKITLDPTLHCTLLFSRAPLEITVLPDEYVCTPNGFTNLGDAIVLLLECPALVARHYQFIDQGGTHDFEGFVLHMTLMAKPGTIKIKDLPDIDFGLNFGKEHTEDLDLEWKAVK